MPPAGTLLNHTRMPCRWASRATTSRPMVPTRLLVRPDGRASRWLASASFTGGMPMPSSYTVMVRPSMDRRADTRTAVVGGE